MIIKWNLTSHASKFRDASVLVLSVGKSGRTWLRVLLNKYLSLHFDVPFSIDSLHDRDPRVPAIRFDHEIWSHYADAGPLDYWLGRNVCPDAVLRQKKVALLFRDPRDVVVSLYFQKTKRSRQRVEADISEFIRDPRKGIGGIVRVMNLWRQRLADHPDCLWMRYEAMKADTAGELARLVRHLRIGEVKEAAVRQAVEFAAFENMKRMEATDAFGSPILRARDTSDPNSFKVREGKVGGFRKHFGPADLEYLDAQLAALDPFYPYRPESGASPPASPGPE